MPQNTVTSPPSCLQQSPENPDFATSLPSKKSLNCDVCNESIRTYHLGAKVCRACASFYKRTMVEGLKYDCREGNGNCDLHSDKSMRTKCRACRFKRCKNVGIQLNLPETAEISTKTGVDPEKTPKLMLMAEGFDEFYKEEYEFVKKRHQEVMFTETTIIVPRKRCIIAFEAESVNMMMPFYKRCYGPFGDLELQSRIKIATKAMFEFVNYNRCFLTAKFCPDPNDQRIAFAPCYCVNPLSIDHAWWFDGYVQRQHIDAYLEVTTPFTMKTVQQANKYKTLGMNKVDLCVFVMLSLWKHAEYQNLLTTDMKKFKEEVMKEWTWSLKSRFGDRANSHLTEFMFVYKEIDEIGTMIANARETMHLYTATGVNMDDKFCDLEQFMKNLRVTDDV